MGKKLDKGMEMEELLRFYFIKSGYYVIRGVPFIYERFEVTDVDLWLYDRTSPISREITIVDIKNKKTAKAIERIFWVQGLKQAVKATKAVIATTDKRKEVRNFGSDLGILVLDGNFLNKLKKIEPEMSNRLTDEDFFEKISHYQLEKLDGDWKRKIRESKSLLAKELSFDSVNYWLGSAYFFAEHAIVKSSQKETALRCFYLVCSFISIAIDFLLKELSFLDTEERIKILTEGFTFGSKGKIGTTALLNMSTSLISQHADEGAAISNQVRNGIERQFSNLPSPILGEFFGKNEIGKQVYSIAREFEGLAMNKNFTTHQHSSTELKGMIGCLLDFWSLSRNSFDFS